MNLLEHYIKEVHSVKTIPHQDWMEEEWVEVEIDGELLWQYFKDNLL